MADTSWRNSQASKISSTTWRNSASSKNVDLEDGEITDSDDQEPKSHQPPSRQVSANSTSKRSVPDDIGNGELKSILEKFALTQQPSCSYDQESDATKDLELLYASNNALSISLKFGNEEYVGVVYKRQQNAPYSTDLDKFVVLCRGGDGAAAQQNWPKITEKCHRPSSNGHATREKDQDLRSELFPAMNGHLTQLAPSTSTTNSNGKPNMPRAPEINPSKPQPPKQAKPASSSKPIPPHRPQPSDLIVLDDDEDEGERLVIDEPDVAHEMSIPQTRIANQQRPALMANVIKDSMIKSMNGSKPGPTLSKPATTHGTVMRAQIEMVKKLTRQGGMPLANQQQGINRTNNSPMSKPMMSKPNNNNASSPSTSSLSSANSLVKGQLPNRGTALEQLVSPKTHVVGKPISAPRPEPIVDAKRFLALGGCMPSVIKKPASITLTMPKDQFSEADDRSMMDLDLFPSIKTPINLIKKAVQTPKAAPVPKNTIMTKSTPLKSPQVITKLPAPPKSVEDSSKDASLPKAVARTEPTNIHQKRSYQVQQQSELQMKIVLSHKKSDVPTTSRSPPIGTKSKTHGIMLQADKTRESNRMVGKAPTEKPNVNARPPPIKTKDEAETPTYQTRNRSAPLVNETKNSPAKGDTKTTDKKAALPPVEKPLPTIKFVDSLPADKNPNNIKIGDIIWGQAPGVCRWPGRVTEFFEDGTMRIYWFPTFKPEYNDIPGNKVIPFVDHFIKAFNPKMTKLHYVPAVAEAIRASLPSRGYFEKKLTRQLALHLDKNEGVDVDGLPIKEGNRVITYRSSDYNSDKKPVASTNNTSRTGTPNGRPKKIKEEPLDEATPTPSRSSTRPRRGAIPQIQEGTPPGTSQSPANNLHSVIPSAPDMSNTSSMAPNTDIKSEPMDVNEEFEVGFEPSNLDEDEQIVLIPEDGNHASDQEEVVEGGSRKRARSTESESSASKRVKYNEDSKDEP